MQDLVLYIVKSLVSKPDEVKITDEDRNGNLNLNLSVAQEDMGMIIGKSGQTIRAIRRLLGSRSMVESSEQRVYLNLIDVPKPVES